METLTKRELVVQVSNETGLSQIQVTDVIQRTLDAMIEALARGDAVEIRNFGVFEVRLSKPRIGRNPSRPGTDRLIPPQAVVKFRPGKTMKQRVGDLRKALERQEQRKVS